MIKLNPIKDKLVRMTKSEISVYVDDSEREEIGGEIKAFLIGGVLTFCAVQSGTLWAVVIRTV